jgi:hypothetical protein
MATRLMYHAGKRRVCFDGALDWKEEEERASRGCVSRKERKDRKRSLKMAAAEEELSENLQREYAFSVLKDRTKHGRLIEIWTEHGAASPFGLYLTHFLLSAGARADAGLGQQLEWFGTSERQFEEASQRQFLSEFLFMFCQTSAFCFEFCFVSDPVASSSEDESLEQDEMAPGPTSTSKPVVASKKKPSAKCNSTDSGGLPDAN